MIAPPTHAAERRRPSSPPGLASLLAAALVLLPAAASAQGAGDAALAEALFQDAKKLMDEGRAAEACPKLAESQRLDPAGGTILLLALCYEGEKKWASAWAAFNDALGTAIKDGRKDREQRARERLAVVESRMTRLLLQIPASLGAQPGLELRREGKEIPRIAWSSAIPIDPGVHRLTATAPGKQPWSVELRVADERGVVQVQLPPSLADAPAASSAPAAAPSAPPSSPPALSLAPLQPPPASAPGPRSIAYGVGAVGLVGLTLGALFGLRAVSKSNQADERCPSSACADPQGVELSTDARRAARVSDVAFVVGAAGVTTGVLLLLFGQPARPQAASGLRLAPGPVGQGDRLRGAMMQLGGSF